MLSKLQTLNVSFYNTVDLNIFLGYLASSSSPSSLLGKTSKEILAENALRTCFSMTAATGEERSRSQGLVSLRSLDIKNRVPDTNFIRWKVFKNTLDRLPSLLRLGLTGIGFLGGKDNTETIGVADPDATTPLPASATANESTNLGIGTHYQGIHEDEDDYDDDDDDDDGEDGEQTRSFESGNGEPRRTYPHLQSLALSFCYCPVTIMLDLDLIFPNLTALEVNKCRNTWLHVFEPDPLNPTSHLGMSLSLASLMSSFTSTADSAATTTLPENANTITGAISAISTATTATTTTASNANAVPTGTQRVPFLGLTHLKLVEQYEGNEDLIYEIVKARPGLVSLETHQISLNVDTLLPMATACSNHRRFFDRFSLSYCWSNSQTRRDYERLFEAPFLSRAKHLYIQQEITKKMQFTSTLISLHIGAGFSKQSAIENDSLHVWNEILRSLPKLEVLRIDRYIKDFLLFEGLGRSSSDSNNNSDSKSTGDLIAETTSTAATVREGTGGGGAIDNWTQERPYLRELHITFRPSCVVQTADLDRELVQRFRFLERLSISCTKRPDDLADYTGRWRPGLTVEHCRNEMRKHGYIE
ncbi:hypothetical protein BGX34_010975 [Mortierella sp. NVP85]|nr:hypothetical protein BGX34_010975 [Mortierella sp. NVP85]